MEAAATQILAEAEKNVLIEELHAAKNSPSWKATKPLRAVMKLLRTPARLNSIRFDVAQRLMNAAPRELRGRRIYGAGVENASARVKAFEPSMRRSSRSWRARRAPRAKTLMRWATRFASRRAMTGFPSNGSRKAPSCSAYAASSRQSTPKPKKAGGYAGRRPRSPRP